MPTLSLQQIADLKASIAKKYMIASDDDGFWFVADAHTWNEVSGDDHMSPVSAEAEMEAIIQDEVKAAMEEME